MKQQAIHLVVVDLHQSTVVTSALDKPGKIVTESDRSTEEKMIVAPFSVSAKRYMCLSRKEGTQDQ